MYGIHLARFGRAKWRLGEIDLPAWWVGRTWCHLQLPRCGECPIALACQRDIHAAIYLDVMSSQVSHVAINAEDPAATLAFYEAVFGWRFTEAYPGLFPDGGQAPGARSRHPTP